ncbi:hypothetical protein C8J57DRAFT_674383 [Mycena rebaudengoi]|nr:hypothetical protein C8J57DRAFT_674383 [Mycena rebaudengoi]
MMNQAPPEICAHIFSFACTDSGYTGRSLSLVSKYFHEVSKPAKLQSIALYGRAQILAFAALLDQTPPHLRTTRALLINESKEEMHAVMTVAYAGVQRIQPQMCITDSPEEVTARRQEWDAMLALERAKGTAYLEDFGAVGARAVERILQHLSPTLELLDLDLNQYVGKMLREPLSMPRLVDLTSRCGFPVRAHPAAPLLAPSPSLRRLHIIEAGVWSARFFEGGISHFAPALTHLRLSQLELQDNVITALEAALGLAELLEPVTELPATIELVLLKPSPYEGCGCCEPDLAALYYDLLNDSRQLRDKDARFVLLSADDYSPNGQDVYHEEWMRKAGGQEFSWDTTDRDLTPPEEDEDSSDLEV